MKGSGIYGPECEKLQQDLDAAVVLLAVFEGSRGSGFSVAAEARILPVLPTVLRNIADGIERDLNADLN